MTGVTQIGMSVRQLGIGFRIGKEDAKADFKSLREQYRERMKKASGSKAQKPWVFLIKRIGLPQRWGQTSYQMQHFLTIQIGRSFLIPPFHRSWSVIREELFSIISHDSDSELKNNRAIFYHAIEEAYFVG